MSSYHIVVCGGLVPDPLQTLTPEMKGDAPALKNEMMLPMVFDPWAAHALYEANHLVQKYPGSKVWLVSMGPKMKLQQLMMSLAQKVPFELVAIDGPVNGFSDAMEVSSILASAIREIPDLDLSKLLLFGGQASASRDAGVTMSLLGEALGIHQQFSAVDMVEMESDGIKVWERIEGGQYLISKASNPPAVFAWSTGKLPVPANNPQVGMMNMRTIMPALQKAPSITVSGQDTNFGGVHLPEQKRETEIVKNLSSDEIAREIVEWIQA